MSCIRSHIMGMWTVITVLGVANLLLCQLDMPGEPILAYQKASVVLQ